MSNSTEQPWLPNRRGFVVASDSSDLEPGQRNDGLRRLYRYPDWSTSVRRSQRGGGISDRFQLIDVDLLTAGIEGEGTDCS
jgi:hypothetical protein